MKGIKCLWGANNSTETGDEYSLDTNITAREIPCIIFPSFFFFHPSVTINRHDPKIVSICANVEASERHLFRFWFHNGVLLFVIFLFDVSLLNELYCRLWRWLRNCFLQYFLSQSNNTKFHCIHCIFFHTVMMWFHPRFSSRKPPQTSTIWYDRKVNERANKLYVKIFGRRGSFEWKFD